MIKSNRNSRSAPGHFEALRVDVWKIMFSSKIDTIQKNWKRIFSDLSISALSSFS